MEFAPGGAAQTGERSWPGNVRQLRNEVMRLAACARLNLIEEEDLVLGHPAGCPRTCGAARGCLRLELLP